MARLSRPHHVVHVCAWRLVQIVGRGDVLLLWSALISREGAVMRVRRPLLVAAGAVRLAHVEVGRHLTLADGVARASDGC